MSKVRVVRAAPNTPIFGEGRVVRMGGGNVGPVASRADMDAVVPDQPFEAGAGADTAADQWAQELERRDRAAGIAPVPMVAPSHPVPMDSLLPGVGRYVTGPVEPMRVERQPSDLTALPDRFALEIERKPGGMWKVTAPGVHVGLFVAGADLATVLADAPAALANIVSLDGVLAKPRERKKRP